MVKKSEFKVLTCDEENLLNLLDCRVGKWLEIYVVEQPETV